MKITTKPVTMLVVDDIMNEHRLDPVRVICENLEPGRGRIIITCWDGAWVGFWGAMGDRTVEQFVIDCHADYIAGNMGCSGHLRSGDNHRNYLARIITATQAALRARQPKPSKERAEREERIKHVNELIKVIGSHGRRFFWNEKAQRFARVEMDARGKLWWIDDYRGKRICMEKFGGHEHDWRGFSHGGTLKELAKQMREYVKDNNALSSYSIAHEYWGYDAEAAKATKAAALNLPCVIPF